MASGSFNLSTSKERVSMWCNWAEQNTDVTNNTSQIAVWVYLRRENNGYTTSGTVNTTVTVEGQSQSENGIKFSNNGTADTLVFAKAYTVSHNADGTKSVTVSIACDGSAITASGSQTVTLSTIPRTSQVSVSNRNFTIGDSIVVYTNSKSSSFTHRIYVKYADGLYYDPIATGIYTALDINTAAVNDILYRQCPNSTRYDSTILLRTMNGSTAIGDTTIAISAFVSGDRNRPTVQSCSYTQTNDATAQLLGNRNDVVKNKSALQVTFSGAQAYNYASVKKYCVTCGQTTYTSSTNVVTVSNVSDNTLTCWIEDSRGFKSYSKTLTVPNIYDYFTPVISDKKAVRYEDEWTKARLEFKLTVPQIIIDKQSITLSYRYRKSASSTYESDVIELTAPDSSETVYSFDLPYEFDIESNYVIEVTAQDAYGTYVLSNIVLQTAQPELSIRKDRVGINCIPRENNGALQIDGKSFIDYIHPVNSIYFSVGAQDPAELFPGTVWERIAKGKTIFGVDESSSQFSLGISGGSASHSHGRGNLSAAIGSCNGNPLTLGFIHTNELTISDYGGATYCVSGASFENGGNMNHYTKVYGNTSTESSLPPYTCVYIWKRTA